MEENKPKTIATIGSGKMSPTELKKYIDLMSNPTFLEYKNALNQIMSLENYYPGTHGIRKVDEKKKTKARKKSKMARKQRKLNRKNGK